MLQQIDELKRNEIVLKQERNNSEKKLMKQVAVRQTETMQKSREFEVKHPTVDSHRLTMTELRKMISLQRRTCAKWKEKCQLVIRRVEAHISELRRELGDHKRRKNEH